VSPDIAAAAADPAVLVETHGQQAGGGGWR
jgi:hypothetical protein